MQHSEAWIRERIRYLDQEGLGWYQNISLGNGIETKSRRVWGEDLDHPRRRWNEVAPAVPDSLEGLSVLDVGCNAGFICFESYDRGARDVCGVDLKQGYIEQASFCAEVREQPIDFRTMSVYDLPQLGRTFDLVFFVGLLYHCKYLSAAVDAVANVCSGTLICESAIHRDDGDIPLVRYIRSSQYGGPDAAGDARLPGVWHPNMVALRALFLERGFREVDELFRTGGRGGVVARR